MRSLLFCVLLLSSAALGTTAAHAQSAVEGRVERLEGEMRAVQRKVFPGGSGQYVQPDNRPATPEEILPGTPASSPVADLTARVDSLEGQLRSLTGQLETNAHRQDLLESRIKALEANAAAAPVIAAPDRSSPRPSQGGDLDETPAPQPMNTPAKLPAKPAATARPADTGRAARVAAVERPDSGDAAEDTYLYGYRLWTAELYPEAEAQFLTVTTKYPAHKRASYAQNLLGRAYLADNKPSLASLAFLDNYTKWPDGDRAPESLMYLAQTLVQLKKPAEKVCKVYTELQRSYAAKIDADPKMKAAIRKGRAESSCS